MDIVTRYKSRKYDEELVGLEDLGGMNLNLKFLGLVGVAEKLNVDLSKGITPISYSERERAFGSNKKDPV
jgi:hypothetical protein